MWSHLNRGVAKGVGVGAHILSHFSAHINQQLDEFYTYMFMLNKVGWLISFMTPGLAMPLYKHLCKNYQPCMFTGVHVGIPVPIVVVSVGIAHRHYGNENL